VASLENCLVVEVDCVVEKFVVEVIDIQVELDIQEELGIQEETEEKIVADKFVVDK